MGVVAKRCDDEKGMCDDEKGLREGGSIAAEGDENKGVEVVVKRSIAVALYFCFLCDIPCLFTGIHTWQE